MPVLFIHGVNNREDDPSFIACRQARRTFVKEVIGKRFPQFPTLAKLQDVYWGNQGVAFAWKKQSLPEVDFESFGPGEATLNLPNVAVTKLAIALTEQELDSDSSIAADDDFEEFGSSDSPELFAALAKSSPQTLFQFVGSPLAESLAEAELGIRPWDGLDPNSSPGRMGTEAANLIMAAHKLASSPPPVAGNTDDQAMDAVLDELKHAHRTSAGDSAATRNAAADEFESYGISDIGGWVKKKWGQATMLADRGRRAVTNPKRAATVLALRAKRESVSDHAFVFLGDIFEYFRRGQGSDDWRDGSILKPVKEQIDAAVGDSDEPLVVITHSFGGEIFYDLLTCGALDNLKVDLWVTVGSQVSLFAEMKLFRANPSNVPTESAPHLPRPRQVSKWINVFDPVDVFSFQFEPVFGDSVADHRFRGGNIATAHGEYLFRPEFYELIAKSLADGG